MVEENKPQTVADTLTVLRAVSHPQRMKITTLLVQSKPMRTSDVANRLGIPANSASFHLRQLEKAGLITKAPTPPDGDARETWWTALPTQDFTTDPTTWAPEELEAGFTAMQASLTAMSTDMNDRVLTAARAAVDGRDEHDLMATYTSVQLTPQQASAFRDQLGDLLRQMKAYDDAPSEGAIVYFIQASIAPELRLDAP